METTAPASGPCNIYERLPYYLAQGELQRRRPVVDEALGRRRGETRGPRVILRHDVDGLKGFERWAAWEEERSIRSVNLLRAPVATAQDGRDGFAYVMPPPDYEVEGPGLREFIRRGIDRGCEFGLHYASARPEILRREAERLGSVLRACGAAQPLPASAHWLQSCGETLRELDRLGFGWDFSLMDYASYAADAVPEDVPHHPGFATGTTRPHMLYDPVEGRWLDMVAVPGALEEILVCGLCRTRFSEADLDAYLSHFERYDGVLVLNWHGERTDLIGPLDALVTRLRERGFEFITTRQLTRPPKPGGTGSIENPRIP